MGTWWRHQVETFSALLAISAGNLPVNGEFPARRPVTRSFDKRLSKQWCGWWFETPSRPLWRHCYDMLLDYRSCSDAWSMSNGVRPSTRTALFSEVSVSISVPECLFTDLSLCSLYGGTSYRKISWNHEAARFGFRLFQSQRYRNVCQISERYDHYNIPPRGFDLWRDLAFLYAQWIEAHVK